MNVAANTCHKMSSNDCDTNVKECGGEMRGNIMFKYHSNKLIKESVVVMEMRKRGPSY